MKQVKIINAYRTLMNMAGETFPLPVAYKLYKLRKALEPQYDFQTEQERAAVEEFNGHFDDETKKIVFESVEVGEKFIKKLEELANMEVELEFEPVTINMNDIRMEITPNDIEKLDGFIIFE